MSEIINKVQEAGLIQLDPALWIRNKRFEIIDLSSWLFMEMVLKEKEFRAHLKDFTPEEGVVYGLSLPEDAIVPNWAYMVLQSHFASFGNQCFIAKNDKQLKGLYIERNLASLLKAENVTDKRVIIKGCSDVALSPNFFVECTLLLSQEVKSLMFGEACSAVPVFKAPKK